MAAVGRRREAESEARLLVAVYQAVAGAQHPDNVKHVNEALKKLNDRANDYGNDR